jgi:hypothetical protein
MAFNAAVDVGLRGKPGTNAITAMTEPDFGNARKHVAQNTTEAENAATGGNPGIVLLGMAGILVILHIARKNSRYLQENVFGITPFSVITIGLTSVLFIVMLKWLFFRFPVPGVTQVVSAV